MDPSTLPYRPCVGLLLFNPAGLVFVGERADMRGAWQMPQGGIDRGEAPAEAAWRELREEVGTDRAAIVAETAGWHAYDLPVHMVGRVWRGRYRGQRQKWFALRFLGEDRDIDLDATGHPEFIAWRWVAPIDLPRLTVPFKRTVYDAVLAELAPAIEAATRG
ncbi:MAG: RNA pyrophosphohydrolase [Alphaproteobacteria bacterium]|nr:RNA pyrophosphohydrolase [Alphaproteobacteria bacterium]